MYNIVKLIDISTYYYFFLFYHLTAESGSVCCKIDFIGAAVCLSLLLHTARFIFLNLNMN